VQETALRALARFDQAGAGCTGRTPASGPGGGLGGSGIYRLRLPGIRILYEVNEDVATIYIINGASTVS
jgi:hypothetical protein